MCKEKKKEETERERMECLSKEYSDIDWVGLYNADKLSSLTVNELSLYLSHHKITCKRKKAEKVTLSKACTGSLLFNCMERHQPRQKNNELHQRLSLKPTMKLTYIFINCCLNLPRF